MAQSHRALIVDDERLARSDLISMLKSYPNIVVAGEAPDAASAEKAIEQLNPDVIFLDIEMPGQSKPSVRPGGIMVKAEQDQSQKRSKA